MNNLHLVENIPIIHPDSKKKWIWECFVMVLIISFAVILPLRIVCGVYKPDLYYWLIPLTFFLDILINFNTGYKKKNTCITSRRKIALHYLKFWFWVDFLAAIPFWPILSLAQHYLSLPLNHPLFMMICLIRLVKVLKINKGIHVLQAKIVMNPSIVRLAIFFFWLSLVLHWMSLGWITITNGEHAQTFQIQYLQAFYWCITTISTIGYGDITPDRGQALQLIYTIVCQIFGVGMYGYIIGNVSSLIANIDIAKANYLKKQEEVTRYLNNRKVPVHIQKKVFQYYKYLWESRRSIDKGDILADLPHTLNTEISLFLNREILEKVPFFKNSNEIFIKEIIRKLELSVFLPGDTIIMQGEYGDCMYFLSSGDVEVFIDNQSLAVLGTGSFFGEMSLVKGELRNATIKALSYCDVYKLSKESFDSLRSKYHSFDLLVKDIYKKRLKKEQNNQD